MIYSIDLSDFVPPDEHFFVDANVLYFIYYNDQNFEKTKMKADAYRKYIKNLRNNGNPLYISALNLQELLHVIEKAEYKKYCRNNNTRITLKEYRGYQNERIAVKNKLQSTIQQIYSDYFITDETVDFETIRLLIQTYDRHHLDPIDFLAVCPKCRKNKSVCRNFNLITADSDFKRNMKFKTDPNINVYTL
ncbi:hypothetical protein MmiHf6_02370 [Methanimicrococcus hongohii]|uniref:PIN domain-containing protein n=1 Tax=Methanimicrococcus hongohii TaxID=3028295 RepID=A0AA97A153_9EURY|nr:PIN domain-containing protein [Methanimicrococcus sp. Hf6]WNY22943.1 hypothetical protein MmiHf6_02370 [Methanimicrococcus sp. Hf6]